MKSGFSVGRKSVEKETPTRSSVSGEMVNRCVIFSASISTIAERRSNDWFVRTKTESDLIVEVDDSSFHLHKLLMVSRSGYLNRLVFQSIICDREMANITKIRIENFPGGTKSFELVVKFCYGWKIEVTSLDIAALYSAAHFLEMTEDFEHGNLISKTEGFLSFVIFSSWKDTFRILKGCESLPTWARELQIILKRCSNSIAWKACTKNPKASFFDKNFTQEELKSEGRFFDDTWWIEDVSSLRIDHFVEVIKSIKRKKMRSELVGLCITKWIRKWVLQITLGFDKTTQNKQSTHDLRRVTTESLIRILPEEENSVSCNFLFYLLKLGLTMKIDVELSNKLEKRISSILEKCCVQDLLVKNYGENDSVYDMGIVTRVVKCYVSSASKNPNPKIVVVGKLVIDYLTFVARDKNLRVECFRLLSEALPKSARKNDDSLYQAIDIYLKAHPDLTEEERTVVCRVLEYHKLSQEARQHALRNSRLSSKITTEFVLLEQVNMARLMTTVGSNYRRTRTQTVIRVTRNSDREWTTTSRKEFKMMEREVDKIKAQLTELHMRKVDIQKQAKRYIK